MPELPTLGDFDYQTVVGPFDVALERMRPQDPRFGLHLQVQYIYGWFQAADGVRSVVERKFIGPMTGGLWLMSTESGTLALHPGALRSSRGETRRQFTDTTRVWGDHLMHKLSAAMGGPPSEPLSLELEGSKLAWSEGDLLSLQGTLAGPGFQYYAPHPEEPLFYFTQGYWVAGTVLGRDVEGFVGVDHGYWQHGREWKEYRFFNDIEVSWEVFSNLFDDGSSEWGVIVQGRRGCSAAMVFEGEQIMGCTNALTSRFQMHDDGFIEKARFGIGDTEWEFTGDRAGDIREFAEARWAGYRSLAGTTRRVGDTRTVRNGWTWIEYFPERIRDEGFQAG